VRKVARALDSSKRRFKPAWRQWRRELKGFSRLVLRLGLPRATRSPFWRTLAAALRRNPRSIRYTTALMALYLHFGPFSKYVARRIREAIAREETSPSRVASASRPQEIPVVRPVAAAPAP
jgi:hypothetical protein